MAEPNLAHALVVDTKGESSGHCDCCRHESRCVWGSVDHGDATVAVYWVNWTVDHLAESGADFDLVLGAWGEDTTSADRVCVSLLYRKPEDHPWSVMVIDADRSKRIGGEIADSGLRRDEVIGTPLAPHVFAVIDAIFLQDGRLFI